MQYGLIWLRKMVQKGFNMVKSCVIMEAIRRDNLSYEISKIFNLKRRLQI